ncbi:MAG TPA: hypothetical protein VGX51_06040 [Solirubrobacteraceae bacterium]|nr:hypothetical protein [Solirubrobacteraceae bacterium]
MLVAAPGASGAFIQQGEKLTGQGEVGTAEAGESVALSADGNTALIGGPCDGHSSVQERCGVGAVWVFTRVGSTWIQQGNKLTGAREIGSGEFGAAVALSANGNTALVGAPRDRHGVGAVWVFTRTGSTWTDQGEKLVPGAKNSTQKPRFGSSVALSEDGNAALIGGDFDRHGRGAAWVFTRTGTAWSRQGSKLSASDEKGKAEFGFSVALSADGNTALIGGPFDGHLEGAAWVFTRTGSVWAQQGSKLTGACKAEQGSEGFRGAFGSGVALSGDGNTALIGQPWCGVFNCVGPHCQYVGRAYAFARSGSVWAQQGKSFTSRVEGFGEGDTPGFAASMRLSADGNTALIAEPGTCYEGFLCVPGQAWEFARSGETWTQQGEAITGSGEVEGEYNSVRFGESVALSTDAKTALIGGPGDNERIGAAWVFVQ